MGKVCDCKRCYDSRDGCYARDVNGTCEKTVCKEGEVLKLLKQQSSKYECVME